MLKDTIFINSDAKNPYFFVIFQNITKYVSARRAIVIIAEFNRIFDRPAHFSGENAFTCCCFRNGFYDK
jgi:hypothetical protein